MGEYEIIGTEKWMVAPKNLFRVPHKGGALTVAYPAFGPGNYYESLVRMADDYSSPKGREIISFREPTTSESISAAAYNFKNLALRQFFDFGSSLQIGRIARTSEGVFVNPPRYVTEERFLKDLLKHAKKIRGIYLGDDDFGFAPYDSFNPKEEQDADTFARGGLARVLEHTEEEVAENLRKMAYTYCEHKVSVYRFGPVGEPELTVAGLNTDGQIGGLRVGSSLGGGYGGYVFGVLKDKHLNA